MSYADERKVSAIVLALRAWTAQPRSQDVLPNIRLETHIKASAAMVFGLAMGQIRRSRAGFKVYGEASPIVLVLGSLDGHCHRHRMRYWGCPSGRRGGRVTATTTMGDMWTRVTPVGGRAGFRVWSDGTKSHGFRVDATVSSSRSSCACAAARSRATSHVVWSSAILAHSVGCMHMQINTARNEKALHVFLAPRQPPPRPNSAPGGGSRVCLRGVGLVHLALLAPPRSGRASMASSANHSKWENSVLWLAEKVDTWGAKGTRENWGSRVKRKWFDTYFSLTKKFLLKQPMHLTPRNFSGLFFGWGFAAGPLDPPEQSCFFVQAGGNQDQRPDAPVAAVNTGTGSRLNTVQLRRHCASQRQATNTTSFCSSKSVTFQSNFSFKCWVSAALKVSLQALLRQSILSVKISEIFCLTDWQNLLTSRRQVWKGFRLCSDKFNWFEKVFSKADTCKYLNHFRKALTGQKESCSALKPEFTRQGKFVRICHTNPVSSQNQKPTKWDIQIILLWQNRWHVAIEILIFPQKHSLDKISGGLSHKVDHLESPKLFWHLNEINCQRRRRKIFNQTKIDWESRDTVEACISCFQGDGEAAQTPHIPCVPQLHLLCCPCCTDWQIFHTCLQCWRKIRELFHG